MKNIFTLKSIDVLRFYSFYKLIKLNFTNRSIYYITFCSSVIFKYSSEKCALKKYYSLVDSLLFDDSIIKGEKE